MTGTVLYTFFYHNVSSMNDRGRIKVPAIEKCLGKSKIVAGNYVHKFSALQRRPL